MNQCLSIFRVFTGPQANGNIAAVNFFPQQQAISSLSTPLAIKQLPSGVVLCTLWSRRAGGYHIRWFDQYGEIQRCGHGALAAAAYLDRQGQLPASSSTSLYNRYGEAFPISSQASGYTLTLPDYGTFCKSGRSRSLAELCGAIDAGTLGGEAGYIALKFTTAAHIVRFNPQPHLLQRCGNASLIVAARDKDHIYFRYFRYLRPNRLLKNVGEAADLGTEASRATEGQAHEDAATGSAAPCLLRLFAIPKGQAIAIRQLSEPGGVYRAQLNSDNSTLLTAAVDTISALGN